MSLCWHLLIFPGGFPPSIFSATELNFRVRYGNGWTLGAINTNFLLSPSGDFDILPHLFPFVKHFFKKNKNFLFFIFLLINMGLSDGKLQFLGGGSSRYAIFTLREIRVHLLQLWGGLYFCHGTYSQNG